MMTFGFQVVINGTQVRLDDEYKNIVILGKKTVSLVEGYQEILLTEFAHENMIACIRHLGFGVSFLGYIQSDGQRVGVRLYSNSRGNANLACFVPFYDLPESGYGVILYSESGGQRFHSNHIYFDVKNTGYLSNGSISTNKDMYVLSNPESPTISFEPHSSTSLVPVYGQVAYRECITQTRPVVSCGYSNGQFSCTTTHETYQTCYTRIKTEQTGTNQVTRSWVTCTKRIGMVLQSVDGNLSKITVTLNQNETVAESYAFTYHAQSLGGGFFGGPVIAIEAPSDYLAYSSPTITIEAIV